MFHGLDSVVFAGTLSYLESRSLETRRSTVGSAKGRNLHITPNMEDRSPNTATWSTGHRSSLGKGDFLSDTTIFVTF